MATIKSEGLLGDKYVEISFGSDQAERLKNGDTIASANRPSTFRTSFKKTDEILDHYQGHHAEHQGNHRQS